MNLILPHQNLHFHKSFSPLNWRIKKVLFSSANHPTVCTHVWNLRIQWHWSQVAVVVSLTGFKAIKCSERTGIHHLLPNTINLEVLLDSRFTSSVFIGGPDTFPGGESAHFLFGVMVHRCIHCSIHTSCNSLLMKVRLDRNFDRISDFAEGEQKGLLESFWFYILFLSLWPSVLWVWPFNGLLEPIWVSKYNNYDRLWGIAEFGERHLSSFLYHCYFLPSECSEL